MILNGAGILIFLSVCGIVASNLDRAVDCRKFVFAPLCRGVAAKRGSTNAGPNNPVIYIDEESSKNLLKNLNAALELLRVESNNDVSEKLTSKQEESESPRKIYQRLQNDAFLKSLFGSRSNSERDDLEFKNL